MSREITRHGFFYEPKPVNEGELRAREHRGDDGSGLEPERMIIVTKAYPIESLRAGMKVARDVLDEDTNVLIGAGTVLDNAMIYNLLDRPIFSVYVEEEEPKVEIPGKENLLDDSYMNCYATVYQELKQMYDALAQKGEFNAAALQEMMDEKNFTELCDGAKAVSQIHNMTRHGDYLVNHGLHVGILAGLMGKWLNWSILDQYNLVIAGLFLDVGKKRISNTILDKKGKLTQAEFDIIKKHPQLGHDLLSMTTLVANKEIMDGITQHHERCDGSGYPNKLKGDQISRFGKILAILDIYDAMAGDRVFAKRRSPFDVFAILYDDILAGKLDTEYGVLFLKKLCHALNGNWVALSNGERGRIVYIDESRVTSLPVVQTTTGAFIDLNTKRDVKIDAILTANEVGD